MRSHYWRGGEAKVLFLTWILQFLVLLNISKCVYGMTDNVLRRLRHETREIFYHGFDNYMEHAFPEDELRPLSCSPLTRDRANPAHIEVNDVLGNYSLTLIDSLSTLAILASSDPLDNGQNADLDEFQDGVATLVDLYGDGTVELLDDGSEIRTAGIRARGFDLDSKVQVFETTIRGVGGLLSAHQFAVGDIPIRGYSPVAKKENGVYGIHWRNGLIYDGQLLRLAHDLAERLLPAFHTATGIPYPRVNLRFGVPFYANSPLTCKVDLENGLCMADNNRTPEITETCSAGAGSLVLEFSTLSRLTGDVRFEMAAKRAFFSVWKHRASTGLIGSGIDAESGQWVSAYTGIGAGIDSFFEYAFKSHILLSGLLDVPNDEAIAEEQNFDATAFLQVWEEAHAGIHHHIYRSEAYQHPHYIQADLYTGASRAFWIDSLSAYYPGLLTLAGELEEATATHLLYTALWTRYSAIPERWSTATGNIESGLTWWGGRPEFIESSWYLYRATKDPWYLHIGEMVLQDITRRCWTECGWAGVQDVRTGELSDRMESFFLGETVKYLYLLFDESHPLNSWDASWVFTTEGHPLVIPKRFRRSGAGLRPFGQKTSGSHNVSQHTCPPAPRPMPFSISTTAARSDIFHAAALARLDLYPTTNTQSSSLDVILEHPSVSPSRYLSPSNFNYYPWTLPLELIPWNATSSKMSARMTFDLSFPTLPSNVFSGKGPLQRITDGIMVNSLSNMRLGMIKESLRFTSGGESVSGEAGPNDQLRIYAISNVALGRDEKVFVRRETMADLNGADPYFTRMKDLHNVDLMIDGEGTTISDLLMNEEGNDDNANTTYILTVPEEMDPENDAVDSPAFSSIFARLFSSLMDGPSTVVEDPSTTTRLVRETWMATLPTGPGAAPVPDFPEPPPVDAEDEDSNLPWKTILVLDSTLCDGPLDRDVVRKLQVIVIDRGGCSFSQKLQNIPSYPPSPSALQLVIIVSYPQYEDDVGLVQPLLHESQTTLSGLERRHPIPVIMVSGGKQAVAVLKHAKALGIRRRWWVSSQGVRIGNLFIV